MLFLPDLSNIEAAFPAAIDIARSQARGLSSEAIWPRYLNFRSLPTSAGQDTGVRP